MMIPDASVFSPPSPDAFKLAAKSLSGASLSRPEALSVLQWSDDDFLTLLAAAHRVRLAHFGKTVKLNFLVNIQSGLCPEDCSYCSQSKASTAPIDKYRLMSPEGILAAAEKALEKKAARLCLVASGRGPRERDLDAVTDAVRQVKAKHPQLEICACLGLLAEGQAAVLREAGVDAYNHNLNTSERFYKSICSTHTHDDRVQTVERARAGGMTTCSGTLFGMGETTDDILDVAYRLRDMKVNSIPVNFLIPIRGTPLAGREELTPLRCLKILCLFRLLCPGSELRIAGGRELHLRHLQPLGLYIANSIFVGDYLTTEGQPASRDVEMIRDMGFEILGEKESLPAPPFNGVVSDQVRLVSCSTRQ